jgi:hypothetical protein
VLTRRGRAGLHVLAGALALLVVWLTGVGAPGHDDGDEAWLSLRGADALAAAPCPSPASVELTAAAPDRLEAARRGRFHVFGPEPATLIPPIDWTQDPLASRRYRQNLHKLRFLEPLLASWRDSGSRDDLALALAVGLDWVRAHPDPDRAQPPEAWSDKVTGDRVPYLAYLARAAACEGIAERAEMRRLLGAMELHGGVLANRRRYVPDNHGLFVDLGLTRLVSFLPFLGRADDWAALARDRFVRTLRARLSEGVWLEHSSAYQLLAIRAVERMNEALGGDEELSGLLTEMRAAAGWMVRPDGELAQLGDSHLEPVPEWAAAEAADQSGLRAFLGAGFAFVRAPATEDTQGYLAITDGFHNLTHKHADELSFELVEGPVPIVTDTGLYDKDPGPVHDFAVSNRAHSTLIADGVDWPITDPGAAYGSGLVAAGEDAGWFAIEGRNRLLERQGIRHRRLFLYRPGEGLVICDLVEASATHSYTRYLHLARGVDVGRAGADGSVAFRASGVEGAIVPGPAPSPTTLTRARGEASPIQGYTAPGFRNARPRWSLGFTNQAARATFATTIRLGNTPFEATGASVAGADWTVELIGADGTPRTVAITRSGPELAIEESGD